MSTIADIRPRQLSLIAGGATPDTSAFRLKANADTDVEGMPGQLAKGDSVVLRVEARVVEVGFADKYDKEMGKDFPVGTERRHVLVADSLTVIG